MESLTISLRELLIAVVLATAIYLIETLVFAKRRRKATVERVEPSLGAHKEDITALRHEIQALRARVAELEKRLEAQQEAHEEEVVLSPYAQATSLARQGLSAGDLCARCGISRGEAELIVALNQRTE